MNLLYLGIKCCCRFGSLLGCESFHADVHAGNLWLLRDGRIGFLDFGMLALSLCIFTDMVLTYSFVICKCSKVSK